MNVPESSSEVAESQSGYEKAKEVAEHLKSKNQPNMRQTEGIAANAEKMENGEIDVSNISF